MREDLTRLSDPELTRSLKSLVRDERGRLVSILKHLAEFDRRRLAVKSGFPSLFDYCVGELRYANGEAARRVHAARAAAKFPIIYRALQRGLLSLTSVSLLAPHLKRDNHRRLIRSALGRKTREVEALVASLSPGPAPVERVRYLSVAGAKAARSHMEAGGAAGPDDLFAAAAPADSQAPQSDGAEAPLESQAAASGPADLPQPARRVHFSFTADEELLREVERARQLLRHKCPAGRLEAVFAEALHALLEKIDPERRLRRPALHRKAAARVRSRRRAVPRRVKDLVWDRDQGRCAFVSEDGRRCGSRDDLEFDHQVPLALGGAWDDPANLRLLCRAHNGLEARRALGDAVVDAAITRRRGRPQVRESSCGPACGP